MQINSYFDAKFLLGRGDDLTNQDLLKLNYSLRELKRAARFREEKRELNKLLILVDQIRKDRAKIEKLQAKESKLEEQYCSGVSRSILEAIETSCNVYDLRDAFKRASVILNRPEIKEALLGRLNHIKQSSTSGFELDGCLNLEDEIEDEIETGAMRRERLGDIEAIKEERVKAKEEREERLLRTIEGCTGKEEASDSDNSGQLLAGFDASRELNLWKRVEKEIIIKALRDCKYNRTFTARVLGVSIRTLRNKLTEYSQCSGAEALDARRVH